MRYWEVGLKHTFWGGHNWTHNTHPFVSNLSPNPIFSGFEEFFDPSSPLQLYCILLGHLSYRNNPWPGLPPSPLPSSSAFWHINPLSFNMSIWCLTSLSPLKKTLHWFSFTLKLKSKLFIGSTTLCISWLPPASFTSFLSHSFLCWFLVLLWNPVPCILTWIIPFHAWVLNSNVTSSNCSLLTQSKLACYPFF